MSTPSSTTNDDRLAAYLAAVYTVHDPSGTFRVNIGARCHAPVPSAGRVHALVTACNPGSRRLPLEENETRTLALHRELATLGLDWLPALNAASDGQWQEHSCWIPDIPLATADALSLNSDQAACVIVECDGIARLRLYRDSGRATRLDDTQRCWVRCFGEPGE